MCVYTDPWVRKIYRIEEGRSKPNRHLVAKYKHRRSQKKNTAKTHGILH